MNFIIHPGAEDFDVYYDPCIKGHRAWGWRESAGVLRLDTDWVPDTAQHHAPLDFVRVRDIFGCASIDDRQRFVIYRQRIPGPPDFGLMVAIIRFIGLAIESGEMNGRFTWTPTETENSICEAIGRQNLYLNVE